MEQPDQVPEAMVEEVRWASQPVLKLYYTKKNTKYFAFGVAKAKLILDHIYEITQFVEKHARTPDDEVPTPTSRRRK